MMIDQRVPTALIHMRNMAKRGRKYNVSIMTISHSVVDFLAPAIKQYGHEISCLEQNKAMLWLSSVLNV